MSVVRDEFTVVEMQELRDETRAMIALHAVALIEQVLLQSVDPVAREVAAAMGGLIEREHELCAAIRAQVA